MTHRIIAIVDDDELDRHIYKKMILLNCPSYRVLDFSSGLEALNYMEKHADEPNSLPDILLLDVRMPYLNGWQYLEQYGALKPRLIKPTRHYVCSSSLERFDMEFQNSNLFGYYMKPVSPKDILKMINDAEQYHQAS